MKKQLWVIFIVVLVAVMSYFLYRSIATARREYRIFCETLTPGMTSEEVLDSLKGFGNVDYYSMHYFGGGKYSKVYVGFNDQDPIGQRTYLLSFENGKYTGAGVFVYIDYVKPLCK